MNGKKNKIELQLKFMEKYQIPISHTSYFEINEQGNKIGVRKAKKILKYQAILNSCDIGLSTVMLNLKFLKK